MNAHSSSWDSTRWRDATIPFEAQHAVPSAYAARPPLAPQLSAPTAVNPASQSALLEHYARHNNHRHNTWDATSRTEDEGRMHDPSSASESYANTDASTFPSRQYERHSVAPSGDYGPQQLAKTQPHQASTRPWRSLHQDDRRVSSSQATDAPLTLQIPQRKDLPRVSSTSTAPPDNLSFNGSGYVPNTPTSLPSFKALREHTTRTDEVDGPEIAPMSSRITCYLCNKLKPMVRDVAVAVADLDENVQTFCNKSITRPLEIPNDSPVRAAQWIIDRLKFAKLELQEEAARRAQPGVYHYQPWQGPGSAYPSRTTASPNPLKRQADRWERDDIHDPKRPRSGASFEQSFHQSAALTPRDERRSSLDYGSRDALPPSGFTPPPSSDSVLGLAYPKATSPSSTSRGGRALPSPSSFAYPLSAAPSLPPPTAHSAGSPALSYQHPASIHTASTNSATSAHIADLQHQVTLKSLALQTLQSEYASLLQKLQRERVKSQTIEKKTSVADQEVNDLTTKNEELTEQVKSLESQLEESEQKREKNREEAARDKEQWGRMLEMGGRLHAKGAEERQKLLDEKAYLSQRIAYFEEEDALRFDSISKDLTRKGTPGKGSGGTKAKATNDDSRYHHVRSSPSAVVAATSGSVENAEPTGLKREVALLNHRVEVLRFTLEEIKRHNSDVDGQARGLLQHSHQVAAAIDRALENDGSNAQQTKNIDVQTKVPSSRSTPTPPTSHWPAAARNTSKLPVHADNYVSQDGLNIAASMARAVSPGFGELGFEVMPSTSSPEELIRALGPLPATAPIPALQSPHVQPARRLEQQAPQHPVHVPRESNARASATSRWVENIIPAAQFPNPQQHQLHAPPGRGMANLDSSRLPGTPHSYHSSPGEMLEDSLSSSSFNKPSPDVYNSDSELLRDHHARQPLRVQTSIMLPPPRPLSMQPYTPPAENWLARPQF